MNTKDIYKIGSTDTPQEVRGLDNVREKLDYIGLDDKALILLLNEARHWRRGSRLRLAHVLQKVLSNSQT
jgi:hypothetical protein